MVYVGTEPVWPNALRPFARFNAVSYTHLDVYKRQALACVLWRRDPTQLLLLDEPTNHLDLASTQAIESALAAFPGAMLVVSHDEAFLQGLRLTHSLAWEETGWRYTRL